MMMKFYNFIEQRSSYKNTKHPLGIFPVRCSWLKTGNGKQKNSITTIFLLCFFPPVLKTRSTFSSTRQPYTTITNTHLIILIKSIHNKYQNQFANISFARLMISLSCRYCDTVTGCTTLQTPLNLNHLIIIYRVCICLICRLMRLLIKFRSSLTMSWTLFCSSCTLSDISEILLMTGNSVTLLKNHSEIMLVSRERYRFSAKFCWLSVIFDWFPLRFHWFFSGTLVIIS